MILFVKKIKIIIFLIFLCNLLLFSTTWEIKLDGTGDFSSIQEGINAAVDGDTVLVYPGTYFENLNFDSKNIILASLELTTSNPEYISFTIIDGQRLGSCIIMHDIEIGAIVQGFTIQNGFGSFLASYDGGGFQLQSVQNSHIINCILINNIASRGGAIYAVLSDLTLSGLLIKENKSSFGGGLYLHYESNINFNEYNRCNIYNNNAGKGSDIFARHMNHVHVVVDTFSVFNPSRFFAEYRDQFSGFNTYYTFDIEHNWMETVSQDFYVATDGNDNNDGLTLDTPLKNIAWAMRKIEADSLNPRTIHVAPGIYSYEENEQLFPIGFKEYVSIIGEDVLTTQIINTTSPTTIIAYNLNGNISLHNIRLQNLSSNSYAVLYCAFSEFIELHDILIDNNFSEEIATFNEITFYMDSIRIENNVANNNAGFYMNKCNGIVKNSIFHNNISTNVTGGGFDSNLYLHATDNTTFENCIFSNSISNDTWPYTISIVDHQFATADKKMINCLFFGNQANNDAIIRVSGFGNNEFINCTFAGNTSNSSTLKVEGNVTITNSIFYNENNNYEIFMPDDSFYDLYYETTIDHCDIRNDQTGIYNQNNVNTLNWMQGNIDDNPQFVGGDEDDPLYYQLSETSPCIDTGTLDTLGLGLPAIDLLGNPRVWGDYIDMGCYEYYIADAEENNIIPIKEIIMKNYPNPFNPEVTINYQLAENSPVELVIYNMKGQKVKTLNNESLPAGEHSAIWDGRDYNQQPVSSGIYLYKLKAGDIEKTKKMILLR